MRYLKIAGSKEKQPVPMLLLLANKERLSILLDSLS
jgi:hypothetical protein